MKIVHNFVNGFHNYICNHIQKFNVIVMQNINKLKVITVIIQLYSLFYFSNWKQQKLFFEEKSYHCFKITSSNKTAFTFLRKI